MVVVLSIVFMTNWTLQWFIEIEWLMAAFITGRWAARRGYSMRSIFHAGILSQLIGIAIGIFALASMMTNVDNEWAGGMLEIWVHPWMPMLEQLPVYVLGDWSNTYRMACFVPFILSMLPLAGAVTNWYR